MLHRLLASAACVLGTLPALAQTTVAEPWVRGTVAQQTATGAFMQITSAQGGRLVSATSPAAGVVEIHQMLMEGQTMKMRAAPGLDLPAGRPVKLEPGGWHVMLLDLKRPLTAGETVALTLRIEGQDGKAESIVVQAPVKALGAAPPAQHHH